LGKKAALKIIGIVLVLAGIVTPFLYWEEQRSWLTGALISISFPLLPYGFVMALVGILLIVMGIVIKEEMPTREPIPIPPAPPLITRICPQCGRVLAEDMKYCPNCGKALG